ncbi:6522_t:CDS:2 [Rhizophagus irregularis]|nr:6522_t:CDS:2 [Rhizophagus irregularis]
MIIICDPNKKKEHFPNAFLIYRALTWKLYKKNSPNVKQQNYSVATGGRWKDVPNEIRNVYTQLSIKLSEDNHVPDGFLIFRAISWETLKERYPNATIASEEWDRLPSEDKTFYIKLYEELSEATKKKKILKSKLKKQKRLSSKSTADAISEAERLFDLYFQDLVNVAKNAYESYSYFEAPEKNCNKKFIDDKKISVANKEPNLLLHNLPEQKGMFLQEQVSNNATHYCPLRNASLGCLSWILSLAQRADSSKSTDPTLYGKTINGSVLSTLSYSFIGAFDCITGSGLSLLRANDKISTKAKEELHVSTFNQFGRIDTSGELLELATRIFPLEEKRFAEFNLFQFLQLLNELVTKLTTSADSLPRKEYSIYTGFEDLQKHPSERPSYVKMFSHWNQNNAMKIGETSFSEKKAIPAIPRVIIDMENASILFPKDCQEWIKDFKEKIGICK